MLTIVSLVNVQNLRSIYGGKAYTQKWEIYGKVRGRKVGGACKLCMSEKLAILDYSVQERLLNSGHMEKCVHERKYMLAYHKGPSDTHD